MKNRFLSLKIAVLTLCMANVATAQDDGARAYMPVPKNIDVLALFGVNIVGNQSADPSIVVPSSELDLNMGVLEYAFSYNSGKKSSLGFVVLPYGSVKGIVDLPTGQIIQNSIGFGDFTFGTVLGLVGPAYLDIKDYVAYKPKFTAGTLIMISAPTGHYKSDSPLNVGANRWSFRIGTPLTWYHGTSFADPKLRTFELLPSVTFFTHNNSPLGGDFSSQKPVFRLEGHIAQSLKKLFLSLDGLYTTGGATKLDDKSVNGSMQSFSLGGTVGYSLSTKISSKLTYGTAVAHNNLGMDGRMWRLILSYSL